MGVIIHKKLNGDCLFGLWEINEGFDELYDLLELEPHEKETLFSFKSPERRIEWLSVRALLVEMTNPGAHIVYNEERKPFLYDNSYNISISHSHKFTSLLLSKNKRVGIDLEFMSHKIRNVAFKFINEHEEITENESDIRYHLYIHWCAKEALYKICDKKNINFKENLTILPFEPSNEGSITGIHHDVNIHDEFTLNYFRINDYIIVYCTK
jgi:4'-phosphopantetheinyl transferase